LFMSAPQHAAHESVVVEFLLNVCSSIEQCESALTDRRKQLHRRTSSYWLFEVVLNFGILVFFRGKRRAIVRFIMFWSFTLCFSCPEMSNDLCVHYVLFDDLSAWFATLRSFKCGCVVLSLLACMHSDSIVSMGVWNHLRRSSSYKPAPTRANVAGTSYSDVFFYFEKTFECVYCASIFSIYSQVVALGEAS
jgi:hypothetical protein